MKRLLYLFAAFLISASASAQDANAKKVLDQVSAKLKTFKGITANFNYSSKSRSGKVNNNVAGKVAIKGNKYYIKQGPTEIFSDGNKIWNYNGSNEVTVNTVDADGQTLTPQKLLTNFYDKDFTYKLVSSAGNAHQIEMVPVDKRKNFQRVNVFVDKSKLMITRATILDKSNNTIEFSLNNINTNASITDNTFVFDKNKYKKNIEVIE
ncbi:LolA family protein [Aridibaculum aurantiacum]|uniref:LolA family protein n=1 Tax=Aridibaculum aurantiacum TaxID=2810307 RepID=UPI001A95CCD1|nr:outer membrane lipoprotein carrier protein LolA [Aridibaculum aurantiacum]